MKEIMKKCILVLVVILFLFSCGQLEINPLATETGKNKNELQIMSEIYTQILRYNKAGDAINYCSGEIVMISYETDSYGFLKTDDWQQALERLSPKMQQETWNDFVRVQSKRVALPSNLDIGCEYVLINEQTPQPDLSNSECVHKFSMIGFNKDKDQALVILTDLCPGSPGTIFFLQLINGQWTITDEELLYVS